MLRRPRLDWRWLALGLGSVIDVSGVATYHAARRLYGPYNQPSRRRPPDYFGMAARGAARAMPARPLFRCPVCTATSSHPTDIAEEYCGSCHIFVRDVSCPLPDQGETGAPV